jgi:hypothetical protein
VKNLRKRAAVTAGLQAEFCQLSGKVLRRNATAAAAGLSALQRVVRQDSDMGSNVGDANGMERH